MNYKFEHNNTVHANGYKIVNIVYGNVIIGNTVHSNLLYENNITDMMYYPMR